MRSKHFLLGLLCGCIALPSFAQRERICDDEQQQALSWIQWAAERRASCQAIAKADQRACLQQARQQLEQAEKEHAVVYSNQIRSLDPSHPVVNGLLVKLRDNVEAAHTAINSDVEPQQIAKMRKQACMNRR